jgi:excisionase family DNA binding protein
LINQLHNEKDVATMLGLSPITIHRLRRAGRLGFYRVGSRVLYSDNHIMSYLESVERPAGSARERSSSRRQGVGTSMPQQRRPTPVQRIAPASPALAVGGER